MTGKRSGVSTVPLLVWSFPILESKSSSLISKDNVKPRPEKPNTHIKNIH
jgi:hypothetical protein